MPKVEANNIYLGDSCELLKEIEANSISLSFWSPPYFLGKEYEEGESYESWQSMLKTVITEHFRILKPGGFLVINIADILSFEDEKMPKIMGLNPSNRKCAVTREMVIKAKEEHPDFNRDQLAALLNCSEQTIDRRLNGNNIRGGRYATGTHVKLVGGNLEQYAYDAGLFLYDKRIWKKDPAWANCKWTTNTLKAVSETEDLYVFWKTGEYVVNRDRLTPQEWKDWGYRQIWEISSVRANDIHPAMFPLTLASRIVKLYTDEGDIVLDPFLGSGTTAIAAVKLNRKFIGIEKMKKYYDVADKAIKQAQADFETDLFRQQ
ncbi:MAG: site-specific DNA-methyltransferase [Bacteroidaceae bacterium]|nr:site-specific DNA-methyltransferase [Bacteroidaceae bacterium]